MKVSEVLKLAQTENVHFVDLKFTDSPGMLQHFSIYVDEMTEDLFENGVGFDGSSIRGFQQIHESDMLLVPDPNTAMLDPACEVPTLTMLCDIKDPITRGHYDRDPRHVARKARQYMIDRGIADVAYFGPEAEFFVFDEIRYSSHGHNEMFHRVDSTEGNWNTARQEGPNLGYKPRPKEGYFPVPPSDTLQDIRSRMVMKMVEVGIPVEIHHHEVAQGGQCEIDLRFDEMLKMCDAMTLYKYIVKTVARQHGKTATFMPKPLFADNGSGMHTHMSLWKGDKNLMYEKGGYANLSEFGLHYVGGLLQHLPALCAFIAPTTNSYKRLVPGFEAPVYIAYSARNRSACVRIPTYQSTEKATRVELRCPDPSCNLYMGFAAMLMAGLDGVESEIDPADAVDRNLYDLPEDLLGKIAQVPGSLEEALASLEADNAFLRRNDVFTEDAIQTYIAYKREHEVDPVRLRPHPHEFYLYHDI